MIKKITRGFFCIVLVCMNLQAKTICFLAYESGRRVALEGDDTVRYSPCSTFKIPLAVMGFQEKILQDELHPVWDFKDGYADVLEQWKRPQNPTDWIRHSCIWYSRLITACLGESRFIKYVDSFEYGNRDCSGDAGKNNGLTQCWLSSSLKISPAEQIAFLTKLVNMSLPVSVQAQRLTKAILSISDLEGWKLYGKTGTGKVGAGDSVSYQVQQLGWFVGWVELRDRVIVFAHLITQEYNKDFPASYQAKAEALEKLRKLILV